MYIFAFPFTIAITRCFRQTKLPVQENLIQLPLTSLHMLRVGNL